MLKEDKDITIYDIARKLNISAATVSRGLQNNPAVNRNTRKRIHDIAKSLGYRSNHFARNLRHQCTHTIGVIVPRLNSYFMSAAIAGIENVATKAGLNIIISQSSESTVKEKINTATMFNNRVDGLLVSLAYDTNTSNYFDVFIQKKIPVVFFDRVPEDERFNKITIDNKKAAKEATEHLIAQGCRRIVHLTTLSERNVYVDRRNGYQEALLKAAIPFNENLVIHTNLGFDTGVEAAAIIRALNPLPDGVFVANDNYAVSCMIALKEAGIRIPKDIAFASFNNDPVSRVIEPHLTTINYPGYEMGKMAMRQLIDEMNEASGNAVNTIILKSELIVRESSQKSTAGIADLP